MSTRPALALVHHRRLARLGVAALALTSVACGWFGSPDAALITVPLDYHAPGEGPRPNFSPKGTQVTLTALADDAVLPEGAARPAKTGTLQVGPTRDAWLPVLATSSSAHPDDLTRLYIDRNRNGRFDDDGPAEEATPSQNAKTRDWWSSFSNIEFEVPFPAPEHTQPYFVNFWIVREDQAAPPDVIRYSRGSWRSGRVTVKGIDALVAAMDGNNDAVYGPGDSWSVLQASAEEAEKNVLSIKEARDTSRFMFLQRENDPKEVVLEFKSFTPDGSAITFEVVDRLVTKAEDRLPDDMVADERGRARTTTPITWAHSLEEAVQQARADGKRVLVDFETTWCGPCKTMDEWIWSDAEVAKAVSEGFVGVKLDGDIEKAHVATFEVGGYPTIAIVDPTTGNGSLIKKVSGYQSSAQILELLK